MKKKIVLSIMAFAAASWVVLQSAGLMRERRTFTGLSYAYGDFENGLIAIAKKAPSGSGYLERQYDNYEIELIEYAGYVDDFIAFDRPILQVEAYEGGWLDCVFGRCGRIVVSHYVPTSLHRPCPHDGCEWGGRGRSQ